MPLPPDDPEPRVSQAERDWRVLDDAAWLAWYESWPDRETWRRRSEAAFDGIGGGG